ncbi:hypothetical protein D3C80_2118990 [compost metagenome]
MAEVDDLSKLDTLHSRDFLILCVSLSDTDRQQSGQNAYGHPFKTTLFLRWHRHDDPLFDH